MPPTATYTPENYPVEADIGWWYPLVAVSGVLTPDTRVLPGPAGGVPEPGLDGVKYWQFLAGVLRAANEVGFPFVLRTGLAAAKHKWASACLVTDPSEIDSRVRVTWAWCQSRGLPVYTWAVRQYVPLAALFTIYEGLPVAREFRFFVRDGSVVCSHPLWPRRAVELGWPNDNLWVEKFDSLAQLQAESEYKVLATLSLRAAVHLPGEWAIDWAATYDGRWVAIDACPSHLAWHSPECRHHPACPGAASAPVVDPSRYSIDPNERKDQPLVCQLNFCLEDEPANTPNE